MATSFQNSFSGMRIIIF